MDRDQQIEAIILRLTGVPEASLPAGFELDEPWRSILRRVRGVPSREAAANLLAEAIGPDGASLFGELFSRLPEDSAFAARTVRPPEAQSRDEATERATRFPSLREMQAGTASVQWLWPSWIPLGMLTLLAAAPGVGKSLVALDLARRIVMGEAFPDGAPVPDPGRPVVLIDAEGSLELLRQRVDAWGLDAGSLYLMANPGSARLVDLGRLADMRRLLDLCAGVRPALVIVDSLASAAPRSEASVRAAWDVLGSLSMIARAVGPAVLVVHHLRKVRTPFAASRRPATSDLRGTAHIAAIARSVLTLSPEDPEEGLFTVPDLNGPRRVEVIKSNLCPLPPPLRLVLEPHPSAPTLRYSALVEPPPAATVLRLCADWLLGFLAEAGGPMRPAVAIEAARRAGFAPATLYRARKALGAAVVEIGRGPRDPEKRWALPTTQEAAGHAGPADLEVQIAEACATTGEPRQRIG